MDWQEPLKKAISYFKRSKYSECLHLLNYALKNGGSDQYVIYDSRAAVYEKTSRIREALLDVKEAIRLAPNRWQCYSRAARLFLQVRKHDEASKMVDIALLKLGPSASDDTNKNRADLIALQSRILESRKRLFCHIDVLPNELLLMVFGYLVDEDHLNVLRISRICGRWRRVAVADASLWDTLVLTKKDPVRKSTWWIKRSKGRIRELTLRRTLLDKPDWSLERLAGIQWDHLRVVRLEDFDIMKGLEKADALHVLSRLTTVEIRDKLTDSRGSFFSLLGDSLTDLTVDGATMGLSSVPVQSLQTLTVRKLGHRPLNELFMLLTKNTALGSLSVDSPFEHFTQMPTEILTLSNLTVLHYSYCSPQLFGVLRLPSLRDLSVRFCVNSGLLLRCIIDSEVAQLAALSLDSCAQLAPQDLLQVLETNSQLSSLTLKKLPNVAHAVLEQLAVPKLCPALTHLDLSCCPDVTGPLLMRVVKPRLKSSQAPAEADEAEAIAGVSDESVIADTPFVGLEQIRSLTVNECPKINTDSLPWLREHVRHFSCVYQTKSARR